MPLQKEITFMDLTLRVTPQGIQTLALQKAIEFVPLYPSPLSSCTPGILCGLVFGMTECAFFALPVTGKTNNQH
jgi:hypothetical protein